MKAPKIQFAFVLSFLSPTITCGRKEALDSVSSRMDRSLAKDRWECLDAYWDLWQNKTLQKVSDASNAEIESSATYDVCDTSDPTLLRCTFPFYASEEYVNVCEENDGIMLFHNFDSNCIFDDEGQDGRILLQFQDLPDCIPKNECDEEVFAASFRSTEEEYANEYEERLRREGLAGVNCRSERASGSSRRRQKKAEFLLVYATVAILWLLL